MSGGSYDYSYYKIDEQYIGRMHDKILDEMMKDLSKLLHDLEWWVSGDYNEKTYRDTVKEFKNKWFNFENYNKTLKNIIITECDNLKNELLGLIESEGVLK